MMEKNKDGGVLVVSGVVVITENLLIKFKKKLFFKVV